MGTEILSRGIKYTTDHLVPKLKLDGAIHLLPVYASIGVGGQ